MKKQVNNYIEEEQALDESDDDNIFETAEEEDSEMEQEDEVQRGKIHTFGKSIYDAMKKIVED